MRLRNVPDRANRCPDRRASCRLADRRCSLTENGEIPQNRVTPLTVRGDRQPTTSHRQGRRSARDASIISSMSRRSRRIQRGCFPFDPIPKQSVQRLAGYEVDWSTEQFSQLVFQTIQLRTEPSTFGSDIEEIDITGGRLLTSPDRPEQRQLNDAELFANLREVSAIDLVAAHDQVSTLLTLQVCQKPRWQHRQSPIRQGPGMEPGPRGGKRG